MRSTREPRGGSRIERIGGRAGPGDARFVLDRSLWALAYRCVDGCPRGRTCCAELQPEVARREVAPIDDVMDAAARLAPSLRDDDGDFASVFVPDGSGFVIESRDDGSCPFLYRTRTRALCSLHTVALRSGRPVAAIKPGSCRHWPIAIEADRQRPGVVRVVVRPEARQIGCVAPARELPGHPRVIDAFRDEIAEICGGSLPPRARCRGAPGRVR